MGGKLKNIVLWLVLLFPYIFAIPAYYWHLDTVKKINNSSFIIINKQEMMLYHYSYTGELLQKSGIACGKKFGNKENIGDEKTPEGVFVIAGVEDASAWSHDFKNDNQGEIKGAYGPYFIRLIVPGQKGIGIHGTHDPNSIGTRASEGCIRMRNDELVNLIKHIPTASVVVVTPSQSDNDSTFKEKTLQDSMTKKNLTKRKKRK